MYNILIDCAKMKGRKTYHYQNKPAINLIGYQVYVMARYVVSLVML